MREGRRDCHGVYFVESYLLIGHIEDREKITEEIGWDVFVEYIGHAYLAGPARITHRRMGDTEFTRVRRTWRRWIE